jgi:hypothetical protein
VTATDLAAEDAFEIQEVLARYAHVIDNGTFDDLDLVFTHDVTMVVVDAQNRTHSIEGLPAVEALSSQFHGPRAFHATLNTTLYADASRGGVEAGDAELSCGNASTAGSVRAQSRFIAVWPDGRITSGDYLDVLQRTAVGWRIRHRVVVRRHPASAAGRPGTDHYVGWRFVPAPPSDTSTGPEVCG